MAHNVTGASLQGVFNRLNEVDGYHPWEANTFSDWSVEAGDLITVSREGDEYSSPVHSSRLVWRGAPQMTLSSTGSKEREAVSKVSRKKYGRGGAAVRANEGIHSYVWNTESTIYSYVDQTATYIVQGVENVESRLGSAILQTAEEIRSEVHAADSQLYSYVDQTATSITSHVEDVANDLGSEILQTASQIRSEVHASNSQLYSYVDQTATSITSHVEDVANNLGSEILQTASQIRAEVHASNSELYSYVDQTATSITSHVEDVANNLGSEILQTASQIRAEVHAADSSLYSYVDQTATSITSHVEDVANDLGSEILQTASQIRAEVHASDSALYSYVDQTATYIHSEVQSVESGMYSYVDQTASGIRQEVANTASGLQSSIQQQANRIGLVVEGTGANASVNVASIVAAINEDGTSEAYIGADHIKLDGNTTVAGLLAVEDGGLRVNGNTFINGNLTMASNKEIIAGDIRATGVRFPGVNPGDDRTLTLSDVTGMIVDAQVDTSTNTLKLWKKGDAAGSPSITFSKAASITGLTGSWSGSTLTVVTNPSTGHEYTVGFGSQTANQKLAVDIDRTNPPEIITGTTNLRVPLHVYTPGTSQYDPAVDRYTTTASLSMAPLLEDKTSTNKITANGTYSPASGYIGFGAVEVNVPSQTITPVLTGGWNGKTFTVSSTPAAAANVGTTISSKHSYDSSIGVHYIDVDAQDTGAQQPTTRARYTLGLSTGSVSSGSRTIKVQYNGSDTGLSYVCPDYGNGQNAVTLNNAAWQYDGDNVVANNRNTNTVSVTTAGRPTQLTKSETVYLDTSSSWSGNTKSIYVRRSNSSGEYVAVGSVTAPSISVSGWSLGTFTAPYSYKPSVTVNGTTYTSGSSLNATGAYNAGWTAGQSTSSGGQLELYRTPTGNITFGTTYTIKAKAYSSNSAAAKTDISGASISITTPAFPTVSDWSLGSYSSPYTYKASVKVGGTTYTSGSLNAVDAYAKGWTNCYNGVQLDSTTATTLSYGQSITVYAQAYSTKDATARTNKQSRTITAPADNYGSGYVAGWNDYYGQNWYLPTETPPSGLASGKFYIPNTRSSASGSPGYQNWERATIAWNAMKTSQYNSGVTDGKNAVTLNNASWQYDGDNVDANNRSTNTVSVSTSGRPTQLTKSATIYLDTSSSWSTNTKTIYVRQNNSSGAYVAKGSVDASARYNAGYVAGWNAYFNQTWYLPTETPPSGYTSGKFYVPNTRSSASGSAGYQQWERATTAWDSMKSSQYVSGWNDYFGQNWYLPTDTPPSGLASGKFYVPNTRTSSSGSAGYQQWERATIAWNAMKAERYGAGEVDLFNSTYLDDSNNPTWSTNPDGSIFMAVPLYIKATGKSGWYKDVTTGYSQVPTAIWNAGFDDAHSGHFVLGAPNGPQGEAKFYATETTISAGSTIKVWPGFRKKGKSSGSTTVSDYVYGPEYRFKAEGSSHSITIDTNITGPAEKATEASVKEMMGVSSVTQMNSVSSNGAYAFIIKCGSSSKCYWFKVT